MDFITAVFDLHRRHITSTIADVLEDTLAEWGPDETLLRVFLPTDVVAAVESTMHHGCWWDRYFDAPVQSRPLDMSLSSRNRTYATGLPVDPPSLLEDALAA